MEEDRLFEEKILVCWGGGGGIVKLQTLFRSLNKVALKESEYILCNIHLSYPGRLWSHSLYVEY